MKRPLTTESLKFPVRLGALPYYFEVLPYSSRDMILLAPILGGACLRRKRIS
jgi:hypothetical protein